MDFSNHVDEMGENLSLSVGNTIEFGYKIIHNYLISLFTVLRGRANMEYFVYMTNDCNLKCEYCSVLLDCEKNNLPIKPAYSNGELIEFIKQTQMLTGDNEISIYFFGGEPSLEYDDIERLIDIAKKELSSFSLRFVLHTNGLRLDVLPDKILNELTLIMFSINYEKIPHHILHPSYFSTIIDNALSIKERRPLPIIARLTVTEKTSIFTELLQVSNFFDYVYWQIENCDTFNNATVFKNTYIYEVEKTFEYWLKYLEQGVMLKYIPFMAVLKFMFFHDRNDNEFSCGYSRGMIYIQTNGMCYACSDNVEGNVHYMGDIHKGVTLPHHKLTEFKCNKCPYRSLCMGRCGRMHVEFSIEHINDYCQMNQAMFKLFLNNKELLEQIIERNPTFKDELENWILEYTEFTP